MPIAWAEAGAAPHHNVIGLDPGLRDPEQGDFRADAAVGYGCRVFGGEPIAATPPPAPIRRPLPSVRPGRLDAGGPIDKDTLWDAALVRVLADVTIVDGATLTVAPGVRVEFADFWGLTVHDGGLQAVGTPEAPIVWTAERSDLWQPDDQTLGAWYGLTFLNVPAARDSSRLRWCVLECGKALPSRDAAAGGGRVRIGGSLPAGIGGAVRVIGASPLVIGHSVLRRNLAERGGAVAAHYGAAPLLVGNLWHDNHALHRGGALYASNSHPVLIHNTFAANTTAGDPFLHTGCLDFAHAKPLQVGGVVRGNPTAYHENIQIRGARAFYTRYCSVEGWLGGEGCQTADPLLDPGSDPPFQPLPGSPVLDAGSADAAAPWLPALDLAGRPRLVGTAPDLGAYELAEATAAPAPAAPPVALRAAPNPFNPTVVLSWEQARPGPARVTIHDARGRLVRTLLAGEATAGTVRCEWDAVDAGGRPLPAGIYLARLQTAGGTAVQKLVLVP